MTNRKFLNLLTTLKDDSSQTQRKYTHIPEKKTLYIYNLFGNFFRGGFYKRKKEEICGRGAELEEEENDRNNKKK